MPSQRVPLYIEATAGIEIHLEQSALRISQPDSAERYVPLRRLSRLMLNQRTLVDSHALLACAEQGIVVLFHNDEGQVLARLCGRPGEMPDLLQLFQDFHTRPDWRQCYDLWLYATERMAIIRMERLLRLNRGVRTPVQVQHLSFQLANRIADAETAANTSNWLHLLVFGWMSEQLQNLGLSADRGELLSAPPDLATDLSRIMTWELEPLRIGWLRRRWIWQQRVQQRLPPVKIRDMVRLFERKRTRVYRVGRRLIDRFHYWLLNV